MTHPLAFCAALCAALLFTPRARAQDLYVGSNSSGVTTDFTSGTNAYANTFVGYDPGADSNTLNVVNTNTVLTNSGELSVGYAGSGNNLVVSNGGTLASATAIIGNDSISSNNSTLVTGAGSHWTNSSWLDVGEFGSGNSLVISDGGKVTADYNGIGYYAVSSSNRVLVTGTSSRLNATYLDVGFEGTGNSLVISNGGEAVGTWASIGYEPTSINNSVLVTGTNSVLSYSHQLDVGYAGSGNSLVISDGGKVVGNAVLIGYETNSSNNSVLVTGEGSVWTNNGNLYVGFGGVSNSLVISNGGTVANAFGYVGNSVEFGTSVYASNNSALVTGPNSLWTNGNALELNYYGNLTVSDGGTVAADASGISIRSRSTLNIGRFGTNDTGGTIIAPKIDFYYTSLGASINFNQSDAVTITSAITQTAGIGILKQLGSGTTTLLGASSYSGGTLVSNGELAGNTSSLQGAINNNARVTFSQTTNGTYAGTMSGTGLLNKLGAGTVILTGNNTYSGTTTIGAGKLVINGDQSGATGEVLVAAGATLGGSGIIGGDTFIAGTHNAGNSPGLQTFLGDLTYSNASVFLWELAQNTAGLRGIAFDGVDVGGLLTVEAGASSTLVFNAAGSAVDWSDAFWGGNQSWLVFSNSTNPTLGSSNVFAINSISQDSVGLDLSTQRPGSAFAWDTVGNDIYLNYTVPEPSTYALLLMAGAGTLWWARRRR